LYVNLLVLEYHDATKKALYLLSLAAY